MSTNFEKVAEFHTTFGHPVNTTPQVDTFNNEDAVKTLINRYKFIQEEVDEGKTAINNKDFAEVADSLIDILYFTYGTLHILGLDGDKLFDLIHQNNMNKLCDTHEIAQLTIAKLVDASTPSNLLTPDDFIIEKTLSNKYIVKNKYTGKVQKSCTWTPPRFEF